MENLKELLTAKTFNRLSYAAVISWVLLGVILLGIFAEMDNTESRFDFRCGAKSENIDLVRGKCFEQYEKQYNKFGIPVYGFVIVNFSMIATVCVIYSQVVKSRVDQLLEANLNTDVERQRPPESRKLFVKYCYQLVARFALGIIFIVLQTQLLYPFSFPSNFDCYDTRESSLAANASVGNIQNTTKYECHNQRAKKKTFWMYALSGVNGLFALIILIEIICILSRLASKGNKFFEDSQFLAEHVNSKSVTQVLLSFIDNLKNNIIEDTETPTVLMALFQPNHGEGERIELKQLDSIYTKLVLIPNRAQYDFPEDREERLEVYLMTRENFQPLKGPEDIFDAENKKILIVGRPGIGKTLFCTKFLRDWAAGKLFHRAYDGELHFDIVFLVKFRRFNSEERLSLRELLGRTEFSQRKSLLKEVWDHIQENPHKVLILFDGMDEYKEHSSIADAAVDYPNSAEQRMPLHALYFKIMNEKLLPGAAVLTTTRPTAVPSVRDVPFKYETFEIIGFSPKQVEEYVENFTKDAPENLSDAGERIKEHITGNRNLLSLCYIPASCFIICSSLLQVLRFNTKKENDVVLPTKLTGIYKRAVKIFFFKHNKQYRVKPPSLNDIESNNYPPEFKPLGKLAFNGIEERKVIFGSKEVQRVEKDSKEAQGLENSDLFHRMPDRQSDPFKREAQFCFLHLTMQEFLAAKHITDTMNEAELRTFVKDHIKKGEWHVAMQFLAGLLGERDEVSITIFTDLLPVETEEKQEWELMKVSFESERRPITFWPTESEKYLALTIIKCLYEGSETNQNVQSNLQDINFNVLDFSRCSLAPADCTAIVHVLKNFQQVSHIELSGNHIGPLGCEKITKLFDNDNNQVTFLNLAGNEVGDEGIKHLGEALVSSKLKWLNLNGNGITDHGLIYLSDKLINSNLESLYISMNSITDKGLIYLSGKLVNSNLSELHLSSNSITDHGCIYLSEKNVNSKLKALFLRYNPNITSEAKQRIQKAYPYCEVII